MASFHASTLVSLAALLSLAAFGCSSGDPHPGDPPPPGPTLVTQTGQIVDFSTHQPVAGVSVTAGGEASVTDANGRYSFRVARGVPFTMSYSAPHYSSIFMQERTLDADMDVGALNIASDATAERLRAALGDYDLGLGSVTVGVMTQGSCASSEGAVVSVSPAGAGKVRYFDENGLPSTTRTSVAANTFPAATVYDVKPGAAITLHVAHPTCKELPFPVTSGDLVLTGGLHVEAGDATTYASVFLQ